MIDLYTKIIYNKPENIISKWLINQFGTTLIYPKV